MSTFTLTVKSFTAPELPATPSPSEIQASHFKSPHIPNPKYAATSPLTIVLSLPNARASNPLFPASHLNICFRFEGTGDVFCPDTIKSEDLQKSTNSEDTNAPEGMKSAHNYSLSIPASSIPRPKVNEGATTKAEVIAYVWRRENLLGKWTLGSVDDLGIEGLKSFPLHYQRMEAWKASNLKGAKSTEG